MTPRMKRILTATAALTIMGLVAGLSGFLWYLDRFVVAHVEIADVTTYEALVKATTPTAGDGDSEDPELSGLDDEPVFTATSYQSEHLSIDIDEVVIGTGDGTITYFVADIQVSAGTEVKTAFADNAFGTNIVEEPSAIAERVDAVFAVNGDFYGFRDTGIVIRNGVIYRDDGERTGLALRTDGTMFTYDETQTSASELLDDGVWNTWSFGPALLENGEIVDGIETVEIDRYIGKRSMQGSQPRTAVGMIDENHFVFVVVDGRSPGYSKGMTLVELATLFQELGATVAYNFDGGGSATMYFNGELVNNPLGGDDERGTSDILYIS